MNRFLGTSTLFFMFLCCEPYVSHGRCMFLGREPYVSLKGNIKKFLKYCFLLQGTLGLCMIVLFL